ncbi:MAG: hypothetical protein ACLRU1_01405 [Veillonella parvula]
MYAVPCNMSGVSYGGIICGKHNFSLAENGLSSRRTLRSSLLAISTYAASFCKDDVNGGSSINQYISRHAGVCLQAKHNADQRLLLQQYSILKGAL